MSQTVRRFGALALGLLLAAGCAQDHATAPTAVQAPSAVTSPDLLGGTLGTVTSTLGLTSANALQRTTPLASDITVTSTIGVAGGTLSIPAAGVTVTIPYGALAQPTVVTMTARKGSLLAYDFGPHGIVFAKPLVFTQKLAGTSATLLGAPFIHLGYYTDSSLLGTTTALVSEILNGVVNVLNWSFTAPIRHFSGYLVIC
jgi:hypothetical protein